MWAVVERVRAKVKRLAELCWGTAGSECGTGVHISTRAPHPPTLTHTSLAPAPPTLTHTHITCTRSVRRPAKLLRCLRHYSSTAGRAVLRPAGRHSSMRGSRARGVGDW